jgi:anti-anti-sigma factor
MVGELDMARESELLNLVMTLDPQPGTAIDIDMTGVSFVDSAGLRGLVKAKRYLDGRNCEVRLVEPQPQLVRIVNLVGLDHVLTFGTRVNGEQPVRPANNDGGSPRVV